MFKEVARLPEAERGDFLKSVRNEDPALAENLVELLGRDVAAPTQPGSFVSRLGEKYGTQVDPRITLESGDADSDFTSEVVRRLAERGKIFGRYELRGEVARGGQGAILRVWDEDLRRNLAMKVVLGKSEERGDTPHVDSRTLGRFLEEAQVTGQLDHPGIVPVHELGLDDQGRVYFTMKLVKGRTLRDVFDLAHEEKEGWTLTRALGVMLKVCEAMSYAHSKGVIHRDLKPSNVMVGRFGEVYVMDWGLARVTGIRDEKDIRIRPDVTSEVSTRRHEEDQPDSPLITMDGDVVGTPAYMSPEQAAGDLEAMGPHSDVYAAGAMLYHLLTGQMPYVPPGVRLSNYVVWTYVQKGPPEPVHDLAPGAPAELVAICDKAMARRSKERYADMGELGGDLRAYLEGRVVPAYEAGPIAELRKWTKRNPGFATSLAAAVFAVVVGLALHVWFRAAREHERLLDADAYLLQYLIAREPELWPAEPSRIPAIEEWLAKAREVVGRREEHVARSGSSSPGADVVRLREARFLEDLQAFAAPGTGLVERMERRLSDAADLAELSLEGEEPARRWKEAIASIADTKRCPAYGGLQIEPQLGLVPIWRNPRSGLWEFWHVASGAQPDIDDREFGTFRIEEVSGIVLVLLPGGPFRMGSPEDEHRRYTRRPEDLHLVVLKPFFLGKYEVTQAQWVRMFGSNPAEFSPDASAVRHYTITHPVEQVDWYESMDFARRLGLRLPTESQWEYAVRAGNQWPYPEGEDFHSLEGFENVGDVAVQSNRPGARLAPWNDDFAHTAPVGTFESNAFGLHDMNGNVAEWVDGTLELYPEDSEVPTDGRLFDESRDDRVFRGGFWHSHPEVFRSAYRNEDRDRSINITRGLRVARELFR